MGLEKRGGGPRAQGGRELQLASFGPKLIGNMIPQLLLETLGSLWFRSANSLQLSAQHLAYVGQRL